jgi:Protein of unknown function (DUF3088)
MPIKDLLFLLRPDFEDPAAGNGAFYCPACAEIQGLLACHPELRDRIEICEVDYPRPRSAVAALLGEPHPGCPVLILTETRETPSGVMVETARTGRRYIDGPRAIGEYFAALYGTPKPHP